MLFWREGNPHVFHPGLSWYDWAHHSRGPIASPDMDSEFQCALMLDFFFVCSMLLSVPC